MKFLIRTSVWVTPVLISILFGSCLVGIDRLAFRDVSHFYTPLYDYVSGRCDQQWLPLWNPLDQTGMPLLGETTTAVCYPIRYLVYALPISSEVATSWYVAMHLLLASWTAFVAARWSGVTVRSASIASVIYPLSGSVLFLYTNPPFLVGAAWLPLALGALVTSTPVATSTRIIVSGMALAMMILAGDPQTAAHALLISGAVGLARAARDKSTITENLAPLVAAAMLAAALSAPQLIASVAWSLQSDRTDHVGEARLTEPPVVGSRRYESYQYSLPPWHLLELAAPTVWGEMFPINQRLGRLIPGEGRIWTPSIYMSVIVLVVAVGRWCERRSLGGDGWMVVALAGVAFSLGHFGLVWIVQTTTGLLSGVDSAVGGGYWFLYQFVPGYDAFRYPAKWLSVFALGAAISTATSCDQIRDWSKYVRSGIGVGLVLLVTLLVVQALRWFPSLMVTNPSALRDEFWGPLEITGALNGTSWAIVHATLVIAAMVMLLRRACDRRWTADQVKLAILVLVAIDVTIAGFPLVASVSRASEQTLLKNYPPTDNVNASRWMRTRVREGWPTDWKKTSDPDRMLEVETSQRAAWFGRWHLEDHAAVLNNMVSIRSREITHFWEATRSITAEMSPVQRERFWESVRQWLAISAVMQTSDGSFRSQIDRRSATLVQRTVRTAPSNDRLRLFADWSVETSQVSTPQRIEQRLRDIHDSNGPWKPIVQGSPPLSDRTSPNRVDRTVPPQAAVSEVFSKADRAEYLLSLAEPTLIVRSVFQDGYWCAEVTAADSSEFQSRDVHRVDYLTQGIVLPRGQWRLRFHYAPWWLGWSLAVAVTAWLGVVTVGIATRLKSAATF